MSPAHMYDNGITVRSRVRSNFESGIYMVMMLVVQCYDSSLGIERRRDSISDSFSPMTALVSFGAVYT
jgi:hypothetical protein